jgi:hypothetical protein
MRKQQICVLANSRVETIKSIKDIQGVIDEFTEVQQKVYSEVESKKNSELDYITYTLEQQKKLADASEVILEALPLKKKLGGKKAVKIT